MSSPFGLRKGVLLEEFDEKPEEAGYGIYFLYSVPKPHSAFKKYVIRVSPKGGLYWIKAIGVDIATSSQGYELQAEFKKMKGKLEVAYGKHVVHDFLNAGSILNEPNYWTTALLSKERTLSAIWDKEEKSTLPDGIESIMLDTLAFQSDSGCIAVQYQFDNATSCEAELAAAEDDAL